MAESAVVYAALMLLLLGMITVGLGVFRYQQIASLAREGARWAAVHGPTYQSEQGAAAPTSSDVMSNAITPKMVGLDPGSLTCTTFTMTSGKVTLTLSYNWVPETFLSPVTLTSTAVTPISY